MSDGQSLQVTAGTDHDSTLTKLWNYSKFSKGTTITPVQTPAFRDSGIINDELPYGLFSLQAVLQPWWMIDTTNKEEQMHSTIISHKVNIPDDRAGLNLVFDYATLDLGNSSIRLSSNVVVKYFDSDDEFQSQVSLKDRPELNSVKTARHALKPPKNAHSLTVTIFINAVHRCKLVYGRFELKKSEAEGTIKESIWKQSNKHSITMFVFNNFTNDTRVLREARALKKAGFDVRLMAVLSGGTQQSEMIEGIQVHRLQLVPVHLKMIRATRKLVIFRSLLTLLLSPFMLGVHIFRAISSRKGRSESLQRDSKTIAARKKRRRQPLALDRALQRGLESFIRWSTAPFHRYLMFLRFDKMALEALESNPSVVYHAHDLNTLRVAEKAARRHNSKLVYDSHELYVDRNRSKKAGFIKRRFLLRFEKQLIRRCDLVITVNESIADLLARRYSIKTPLVVMNTPPPQSFDVVKDKRFDLKRIISIDSTERLAIYVGAIQYNRGLEALIKSLAFTDRGHLVLMGYGNPRFLDELTRVAEECGVQDRYSIYGPVPSDQVSLYASSADIGIAPIQNACLSYYLCSPNKVFEYIHAGLPVAASDFPELKKVVLGEEIGAVFDPEDPKDIASTIKGLLIDGAELSRMRRNTLKAAKKFHWGSQANVLLNAYMELMPPDALNYSAEVIEDSSSFDAIFGPKISEVDDINAVIIENSIPGEGGWGVPAGAEGHEHFQAFLNRDILKCGDTLSIHCSAESPLKLRARIYRIGWYDSRGARQHSNLGRRAVNGTARWNKVDEIHSLEETDLETDEDVEEEQPTFTSPIGENWAAGTYIVKLSDDSDRRYILPFWIYEEQSKNDILVVVPTIANQLYNDWGNNEFRRIAFSRGPQTHAELTQEYFLERPFSDSRGGRIPGWVFPFARWSEKEGIECDWTTDEMLNSNPEMAMNRRTIVLLGDSRFWSEGMHEVISRHLSHSGTIINLGCGMGEQLIEVSANRRVKCVPSLRRFDLSPLNTHWSPPGSPYRFAGRIPSTQIFNGRSWGMGDSIEFPVQGCWDQLKETTGPRTFEVIYQLEGTTEDSPDTVLNSTLSTYPNGARVFHAALENWSWLLDGYSKLEPDEQMQDFIRQMLLGDVNRINLDIIERNKRAVERLANMHWNAVPAEDASWKTLRTTSTLKKLCILTAIWKRPHLTRIVLDHFENLRDDLADELELCCVVVGSEEEQSRSLTDRIGFEYVEHENSPLSSKWEAGLKHTREIEPDAVLIMGSDDLISADTIRQLCSSLSEGRLMVGLLDMYVLDLTCSELHHWEGYLRTTRSRQWETIGLARCLSKELLEMLDYSLWGDIDIDRGLDGAMTRRLASVGLIPLPHGEEVWMQVSEKRLAFGHVGLRLADIDGFAMDVKSSLNISSLESYSLESSMDYSTAQSLIQRHLGDDILGRLANIENEKEEE